MKSLKWPACSAASWRLSVKASNLRVCGAKPACCCIHSSAAVVMTVVAELRPSAESDASRLLSLPCTLCAARQRRQKRNLPDRK